MRKTTFYYKLQNVINAQFFLLFYITLSIETYDNEHGAQLCLKIRPKLFMQPGNVTFSKLSLVLYEILQYWLEIYIEIRPKTTPNTNEPYIFYK